MRPYWSRRFPMRLGACGVGVAAPLLGFLDEEVAHRSRHQVTAALTPVTSAPATSLRSAASTVGGMMTRTGA